MNHTIYWKIAGILATAAIICSVPLYIYRIDHQAAIVGRQTEKASFAGSQKCAECHKIQYDHWKGSHHDLAMDIASDETVLGNFDNVTYQYFGSESRFYRKNGEFWVQTQGPKGRMGDYQIKYVFGVNPLQQYLIPFPGGRLQCLPIAWDAIRNRWYHLNPEAPVHFDDWLYWTNAGQNWNGMCAECHSTNLKKNYDAVTDTYRTTWSEIDVGCEACHGPGSRHVAWAELPAMARPQNYKNYELTIDTGSLSARDQVERCAPCHSRRAILGDYTHHEKDLLDSLLPTLLNDGLYYPDGQILDEVYVYGSFTQSKMYHRDVRCSDCHDVHRVKPLRRGNALCLQCHRAAVYDSREHHFHKGVGDSGAPIKDRHGAVLFEVGSGAQCAQCHMPGRVYMGIDYRPDHSFRVPRPDLSIQLNTPNACNRCHWAKSAQWADQVITQWYGPGRDRHYGSILAAGRQQQIDAGDDLIKLAGDPLYPVIVRATALSLLRHYPSEESRNAISAAVADPEPLIRHAALNQFAMVAPDRRIKLLSGMLYDSVRAVRMEAANQMSVIGSYELSPDIRKVYQVAIMDYQNAMTYSADFSFGRFNLGNLFNNQNQTDRAMEQYQAAIKIDTNFYPAKVNLAMLHNGNGDKEKAEQLFREALDVRQDLYEVHYSLGLLLAEEKRYREAAQHLGAAAGGMPRYERAHYNAGQLWDYLGDVDKAQKALERAHKLNSQNSDYLKALIQFYLKHRKHDKIKKMGERLLTGDPQNPLGLQLLRIYKKLKQNTK
jgi:tetratricopeptide (TPR) repeat protein